VPPLLRILHRAGNFHSLLPLARHPAVDAIESDIWIRYGETRAHHGRSLPLVPLMLDGKRIKREPPPLGVADLLAAMTETSALVLDLRSWFGDPAPDLARVLLPLPDRSRIIVTCESWDLADRVQAWIPGVRVVYSVRTERQLRRYVQARLDGALPQTGVTVRHPLLNDAEVVQSLRRHAGWVGAWTVDEQQRAADLVAWGVDALTSNSLAVLGRLSRAEA